MPSEDVATISPSKENIKPTTSKASEEKNAVGKKTQDKGSNKKDNQKDKKRTERVREPVDLTFPNGKPSKPDEDAFKSELERLDKSFNEIKEKRQAVYQKLEKFDTTRKELIQHFDESKKIMDVLIKEKNEINKLRELSLSKLKDGQASVKKQFENVRNTKSKLGYSHSSEIDKKIEEIEKKISTGGISLFDEKKLVQEISSLKRSKKAVEELSNVVDNAKQIQENVDDIRNEVTDLTKKRDEIFKKIKSAREESDKKTAVIKKKLSENEKLIEERNKLSKTLKEIIDERDVLYKKHNYSRDEFYAWQRIDQQRKQESYKAKAEEEKKAKILAKAEKAREEAEVPVFIDEINTCVSLIDLLSVYVKNETKTETRPEEVKEMTLSTKIPDNVVEFKKPDDDDSFFFNIKGSNDSNKKKKNNKQSQTKRFVFDIETLRLFDRIDITCPTDEKSVPATVEKIREKHKWYLDNQVLETEKKKKIAEERISRLISGEEELIDDEEEDKDEDFKGKSNGKKHFNNKRSSNNKKRIDE